MLNNVSERSHFAYMSGQSSTHAFLYDIYTHFLRKNIRLNLKHLNMFHFFISLP
jgi:hypothetical protein